MNRTLKKQQPDINKFSFAQMISNGDGKTSASGAMGVFICIIGGICFLVGSIALIFFKGMTSDILVQSISMVYAGALLLGYRKSADSKLEMNATQTEELKIDQPDQPEKKKDAGDENLDAPVNS